MKKLPQLTALIKKLAPKVGAKIVIEPEWGLAFQLVYKNGVTRSFIQHYLDLNHMASATISADKGHAKFFIEKLGYPVAKGTTVYSDVWAKTIKSDNTIDYGIKYARKSGYPLVVKPNSLSQGKDLYVVYSQKELVSGLKDIFKNDRVAIIERYLPGRDYRIVVLDGEVLHAYERIPFSVVGDGKKTIATLIKNKKIILRGKNVTPNPADRRIKMKLSHQGYSLNTILTKGEKVSLLYNANLSAGAEDIDVTNTMHQSFKKNAVDLTKKMGLRLCGVDLMVTQGDISKNPKDCAYYIIEINSAIGLDPLESTYLKILKALARTPK